MSTRELIGRAVRAARQPAHLPRRITVLLLAAASVTTVGGMAASALTAPPPRSAVPVMEQDVVSVGLGRSVPVRIVIPALEVDAEVVPLKLGDGGLGLPADAGHAGWYEGGTSPGELGSAVLMGRSGPSAPDQPIFAELDKLATGAAVQVARADGATATFEVVRVERLGATACLPGDAGCAAAACEDAGAGAGAAGGGQCRHQDGRHDTGGEVQLRLVAAYGTDPPVDHEVVVFATLRA